MTEPLVGAEVDLRGLSFVPLFGDRLFKSTTWIEASAEARCAALRLWWHAYAHEVPAASLPDNERVLAQHAGVSVTVFRRLRPQALRGWIKCDDGRLYHEFLAEIALDAWKRRVGHRARTLKWREKKESVTVTSPSRDARQGQVQGQGERQGQGQGQDSAESESAAAAAGGGDAVDRAFALWQQAAAREGWPDVMFLNSVRRWKLAQRLAESGGLDGWRAALDATKRAEFLKGPDGRFHRWFDLDWLLDEQKFTRLLEGRYDRRHRPIARADSPLDRGGGSGLDAALAALGRAGAQPGGG
jgi:hypothetical protein